MCDYHIMCVEISLKIGLHVLDMKKIFLWWLSVCVLVSSTSASVFASVSVSASTTASTFASASVLISATPCP